MSMIILTAGKARAKIATTGGEMHSYKDGKGRERIWDGDPEIWSGHGPILFPIVGRLPEGKTKIAGETYTMPMHGVVRRQEFQVEKQGDDFVELVYCATAETKTMYPFDFALHVTYTITETGFSAMFQVENKSDKVMPFCIGGHPAFCCPMEKGEKFTDYQIVFDRVEDGEDALVMPRGLVTGVTHMDYFHNTDTLPLDRSYFDINDTLILTNLKSKGCNLINPKTGRGLRFTFPKFPVLGIWSKPGKEGNYICLEPWLGMPGWENETGNMEDKPHVVMLAPGRAHQSGYEMACID